MLSIDLLVENKKNETKMLMNEMRDLYKRLDLIKKKMITNEIELDKLEFLKRNPVYLSLQEYLLKPLIDLIMNYVYKKWCGLHLPEGVYCLVCFDGVNRCDEYQLNFSFTTLKCKTCRKRCITLHEKDYQIVSSWKFYDSVFSKKCKNQVHYEPNTLNCFVDFCKDDPVTTVESGKILKMCIMNQTLIFTICLK